jgi:hypothetical protein
MLSLVFHTPFFPTALFFLFAVASSFLCAATCTSVEATVAACLLRLLSHEASWAFCFCCGFVLSSVSPAVVVPSLVALQDDGYGEKEAIR